MDETIPDDAPTPHVPRAERDRRWVDRTVGSVVGKARALGPAYAARLGAQALPFDPLDDLLTLAARRVVPLGRRLRRRLPRDGAPVEARAFAALLEADRRVLLDPEAAQDPARLDHAAAALERLARNARSARRRGGDAPIDES
jgi:hypothetical protein